MDWSVSPKDEVWFLHVCHHISNAVYLLNVIITYQVRHLLLSASHNTFLKSFVLKVQEIDQSLQQVVTSLQHCHQL